MLVLIYKGIVIKNKKEANMVKKAKKTSRSSAVKKSTPRKVVAKKVTAKKRPVASRKRVVRKKVRVYKHLGVFACLAGLLGLIALVSFTASRIISPVADDVDPVLGVTTNLLAPVNFRVRVENFRVQLSWVNTNDDQSQQYVVWTYDSNTKKYQPRVLKEAQVEAGQVVTYMADQRPGTTLLYRISACRGCDASFNGEMGPMSGGIAVTMPRLPRPSGLRVFSSASDMRLSWRGIKGVDGYIIYRSVGLFNIFGEYEKIAEVGVDGTYSAQNYNNPSGCASLPAENCILTPIDQASPTTYVDTMTLPRTRYNYRIVAKKMINPIDNMSSSLKITSD